MPELPDVETFRRYFDATSLHKKIKSVEVNDTAVLKKISGKRFKSSLAGRKFESSSRRGKYIFVLLDNGDYLVLHFGMTGYLKYFKKEDKSPGHERILFNFSNGYKLAYVCQRKLGRVMLAGSVESIAQKKDLGVDALDSDLDADGFREIIGKRKGMIKSTLMNQSVIAGIGNIYSDEILFQAGVDPRKNIQSLSGKKLDKIYSSMRRVLKKTVEKKAEPDSFPRSYIIPRREEGKSCPRCGGTIKKIKVNNRSTYFCPKCQK